MSQVTRLLRFSRDVRAEVSRITWPTWPETKRLTFMVVVLAVLVGAYLALIDTAIGAILASLFGIQY